MLGCVPAAVCPLYVWSEEATARRVGGTDGSGTGFGLVFRF